VALGDFLDRLGPTLASGILLAILTAATTAIVVGRDHVAASNVRLGNHDAEIARLRADLESFRAPGGRFTVHDGARLQGQLDDHERRLREQETRPPRLSQALTVAVEDVQELKEKCLINAEAVKHLSSEQERLCQRLRQCDAPAERRSQR
jgi:chromosome segregation ATPase